MEIFGKFFRSTTLLLLKFLDIHYENIYTRVEDEA